MNIPRGATHFTYDPTDYQPKPEFWKHAVEKVCYEWEPLGEEFYAWFWWDNGQWVKQVGVRNTRFKRIEEYATTCYD